MFLPIVSLRNSLNIDEGKGQAFYIIALKWQNSMFAKLFLIIYLMTNEVYFLRNFHFSITLLLDENGLSRIKGLEC